MASMLLACLVPVAMSAEAQPLPASLGLPPASTSFDVPRQAQPAPTGGDDPGPPIGDESNTKGDGYGTRGNRTYLMQINARARYLSVPSSVLDPWFFDSDDAGANPFDRPKIRGWAFGGEYVFDLEPGNYVIYAEYIHSMMGEGYWDDVEEPADHDDGDWVRPDGFGAVVFGATYLHEVDAIPTGPGASDVGLSFLFGAGLGLVVVTGGLEQWYPGSNPDVVDVGCGTSSPAYDRYTICEPDGYKRIPKVLPMLDLSASTRLNFSDHFHIRIDGGLHNVLSLGTAMGVVF